METTLPVHKGGKRWGLQVPPGCDSGGPGSLKQLVEGCPSTLAGLLYESSFWCPSRPIRLIPILSSATVGMSTVPEVIVARHCGLRVLGLSLITNRAATSYSSPEEACHEAASHEAVLRVSVARAEALRRLLACLTARLGESPRAPRPQPLTFI